MSRSLSPAHVPAAYRLLSRLVRLLCTAGATATARGFVAVVAGGLIGSVASIIPPMQRVFAEEPVASAKAATALDSRALNILRDKCWNCHGAEKQESGLRLDSREAFIIGGDRGPAIRADDVQESLILRTITAREPDLEMPPKNPLSSAEIEAIERWLASGFQWPNNEVTPLMSDQPAAPGGVVPDRGSAWDDPQNPVRIRFGGERLDGWSWQAVRRHELPPAGDAAWERGPIDRWLAAEWTGRGDRPARDCQPLALARRTALDLTGLPPTEEALAGFLDDPRPDAFDRFVDRLLASPRYGEHVARMWLDVARYSDSNGFDWDEFRPHAWRYRDYVVRAFNRDLPFDEFIRQQLAGDELQQGEPQTIDQQDYLLATGFLRMGPHDNAAGLFNEQDRSRAELMADLTETTASAFLGQTFACCRCHDHKTDPFLQEDHYRLRAFFAGVEFADDLPIDLAVDQAAIRHQNAPLDKEIARLDTEIQQLEKVLKEHKKAQASKREVKSPIDSKVVAGAASNNEARGDAESTQERLTESKAQREALARQRRPFTRGLLMRDRPGQPPSTFVFLQGDHRSPRNQVDPGIPSAFASEWPPLSARPPSPNAGQTPSPPTGRRSRLAQWIASPENPWTARVIVNRLWQLTLGEGLVATPNDFGFSGAPPTHPALLDWLADDLVRSDWSLKWLIRQIVTSSAYRQVALSGGRQEIDSVSGKRLASIRDRLRRLSAEQTRDALLACSGLLELRTGGPPVWPELPPEILQANPAFLDDNATKTKGWYPSPRANQYVRSLFLVQKRTVRIPLLETLDLPENSVSCARRESSIVAPQALSLLNGQLATEAARALAERCQAESQGDPGVAITAAFKHVLQRLPSSDELQLSESFLAERSLVELCRSLLNTNELMFVP